MSPLSGSKLFVSAVSTWNNTGIKQAEKSINKFQKISAFAKNEAQVAILTNSLKNLGLGYAAVSSTNFIDKLSMQTGVIKDELFPAYQKLVIATGSIAESQKELSLAVSISRGTGKDLALVVQALSKAYLGNATSLTRLGAGLDKTLLKTGNMILINKRLAEIFGGDASTYAQTFAGQLAILGANAEVAKEKIGKGLVDAIKILAGSSDIQDAANSMQNFADATANAIVQLAQLLKMIGDDPIIKSMRDMAKSFGSFLGKKNAFFGWGPADNQYPTKTFGGTGHTESGGAGVRFKLANDKMIQALKDEAKLRNQANADAAAKLKAAADQKVLDDLKKKLDIERIGLVYALSQADSEATKEAIRGKIALLDSDAANAKIANDAIQARYDAEQKFLHDQQERSNAATDAFNKLGIQTKALGDSFDKLAATTGMAAIALAAINAAQNTGERFNPKMTGAGTNVPSNTPTFSYPTNGLGGGGADTAASTNPNVYVLPAVLTDSPGFQNAVQDVVQNLNRMGSPLAGSSARGD